MLTEVVLQLQTEVGKFFLCRFHKSFILGLLYFICYRIPIALLNLPSLSASCSMSCSIFLLVMRAYICVVLMLVCPSIFDTLSIGTPLLSDIVANVWRARWKVKFFLMPQISAISFKYALVF